MKNKYFYPIFKLKSKSWIRYWLLKKTEFKGKLSEILEGFSFNLQNTLRQKFVKFEIEGHSIQNGTPTPENEVPIESCGDNGSINERIVNKNLATYAGDGYLATDGSVSTTTVAFYTDFIPIPENKTKVYYYGSNLSSSMTNVYCNRICFYDENKEKLSINGSISTPTVYTVPANTKYIRASFLKAVDNAMLVFGGATSYVLHQEQTYSVYTQQPFRSIGTVRDCFVKKSDGWYERHKIKRLIFDGTENWQFDPSHYRFLILLSESQLSTNRSGKSNYFKIGNTENTNNCFSFSTTAVLFRVDETITSKADAKSWVATKYANGRPLYTDYLLAEPLDLPCTEEQTQQLENLASTYNGQTNIYSEDDISPFLKIQYWESDVNG